MDRNAVILLLQQNKAQLQAAGMRGVSLFGSTARGHQASSSDVDLAVTLTEPGSFDLFRFAALNEKLRQLLGTSVDVVVEPARNRRMQTEIDRDRVRVF
ncbi:MAG: nucleotidyltransferase domain-containing protein [Sphingomonadaceae bacterium]|nr:nucleotidyltransferase domain-containing protein [Sphingomonadaceae bacterium]